MANTSTLIQFGTAAIAICVLIVAGIIGFNLIRNSRFGESTGLFPQRMRRLSFIERASLDGGRKLLLIRRDDVEHLVMIGGPIDIVVETGIQSPGAYNIVREHAQDGMSRHPVMDSGWRHEISRPGDRFTVPPQPELSVPSRSRQTEEETLELTQVLEAKA